MNESRVSSVRNAVRADVLLQYVPYFAQDIVGETAQELERCQLRMPKATANALRDRVRQTSPC